MRKRFIVHSPNWLGDAVMFLPAWRMWRQANADAEAVVVAKARVAALWRLVAGVDRLIVLGNGRADWRECVKSLREAAPAAGIAVPASFRSAWLLWRGGASPIRGVGGQFRSLMIGDRVSLEGLAEAHQSLEYARIMGVDGLPLPPPSEAVDKSRLPAPSIPDAGGCLAILPGAARGGSKRWPAEYFAGVANMALDAGMAERVAVCGTPGEAAECEEATARIGPRAVNLCGRTSLPELAAMLAGSRAVLSNDSGGMHLAAAMGTPVVAVFGVTDPSKTGPLGNSEAVVAEGVRHSRAVPRESAEAERALRSVAPERVFAALGRVLAR